jgi:hypothetical protein
MGQPLPLLDRFFGSFRMRIDLVLLISLSCAGCALSQKPLAQAPAAQQAATPAEKPAAAADAAAANFECSDGTVSVSQYGCLVNMARARLPPSQQTDGTPTGSLPPPSGSPAGAAH